MQNEYQLRLKDLNLNERIKDITEKFTHELESDKAKFELLLQEKNEQEMEYEEKLKQAEERCQLVALMSSFVWFDGALCPHQMDKNTRFWRYGVCYHTHNHFHRDTATHTIRLWLRG